MFKGGGGASIYKETMSCNGNSPTRHVGCKIQFAVAKNKALFLTLVCIFMLYITNQTFTYMFMSLSQF